MNRRSFVMSLFGGVAAASVAGAAFAQSAGKTAIAPAGEIDDALKAALDQADADFNQVSVRIGPPRRRRRPVVVRRRVIVRRPRRRRVITRRVIVR